VGPIIYSCNPRFYPGGESKKIVERQLSFRQVRVKVRDVKGKEHDIDTALIDHFLYSSDPALHPLDQRALYIDFKERMKKQGKDPGSPDFKMAARTDKYFNALQAKFGYAITCHKSQGGEWPFVFVDFNVFMGKVSAGFFRWAYTAVTRSSKVLATVDSPDFNSFTRLQFEEIQPKKDLWKKAFFAETSPDNPLRFVDIRVNKLNQAFQREGITISWDRADWFLLCNCTRGEESATIKLHFKKDGFSKATFPSISSPSFKSLLRELLKDSLIPDHIPFQPQFPAMKDLHTHITESLTAENAVLTNIIRHPYSDKFYFMADQSFGMLEFFHNSKQQFTKAVSWISDPDDDVPASLIEKILSGI
ncbi:MAG: hypothetical protein EA409_00110, partial [Saprospirales bacterium]